MPEPKIIVQRKALYWIYLLPVAHLCACLWINFADTAWMPIIFVDFPVSGLLLTLAWRLDYPMFWFGVLGTVWWCLLSYMARAWILGRSS